MTTGILQKRRVCELLRQIKPDAHVEDQNAFWTYVSNQMAQQTRSNLTRAIDKGGNAARSSVSQAYSSWISKVALSARTPISRWADGGAGVERKGPGGGQRQGLQGAARQGDGPASTRTAIGKGRGAETGTATTSGRTATTTPTTTRTTASTSTTTTTTPPSTAGRTKGGSGKGSAKAAATRKTPWHELTISGHTPLAHPSGVTASKVEPKEDDEPIEQAKYNGYIMATSNAARKWVWKLAQRELAYGQVVIVQPGIPQADMRVMEDTLKEWEVKLNDERMTNLCSFSMTPTSLVLHDPALDEYAAKNVIIIHIKHDESIYPVDADGAEYLGLDIAAELPCAEDEAVDIAIDVIKPLCDEASMGEWASELFAKTERRDIVKMIQTLINEGKPDASTRVRILANRAVKYRGQLLEGARIKAIATVTLPKADTLLARSGQYGVIYEYADRDKCDHYVNVKLPLEWTVTDCNSAIAAMPQQMRKKVKGFVPSARGFMARVLPEDCTDVTKELNPKLAEELGPALGIQPTSSWLIKGLPKRISRQELINTLASSAGPWTSWFVLPKYAVNEGASRWSSWVVEAEDPPPAKMFKARGNYATIQRFVDERSMHPSARVWAKPIAQIDLEKKKQGESTRKKAPWETKDDDDIDVDQEGDNCGDDEHVRTDDHAETEDGDGWPRGAPKTPPQARTQAHSMWRTSHQAQRRRDTSYTTPTRTAPAARPRPATTDSEGTDGIAPPRNKRKGEDGSVITQLPWPTGGQPSHLADHERAAMQAEIDSKNAQIAALQESMARLQASMDAMVAALTASGAISAGAVQNFIPPAVGPVQPPHAPQPVPPQPLPPSPSPTPAQGATGVPQRENWHDTTVQEQKNSDEDM